MFLTALKLCARALMRLSARARVRAGSTGEEQHLGIFHPHGAHCSLSGVSTENQKERRTKKSIKTLKVVFFSKFRVLPNNSMYLGELLNVTIGQSD